MHRLESCLNSTRLARAMDLKRLLMSVEELHNQLMDEFVLVSKTLVTPLLLFSLLVNSIYSQCFGF